MLRSTALLCLVFAAPAACGPTPRGGTLPAGHDALRGLPPHQDPPLDLDDDLDLDQARGAFAALAPGDGARPARRKELFAAHQRRIQRSLLAGDQGAAFRAFQRALELWSAAELASPPAADLGLAADTAQVIYARFARSGGGLEAITALAALVAADPDHADRYRRQYDEIEGYLDSLAVAEGGEGMQRHRPIELLEEVTVHFPSPWAGETLVALLLERQRQLQARIAAGESLEMLRPQTPVDPFEIVVSLLRVYARLGRLDADAAAVLDGLSGQVGDRRELRDAFRRAIAPGADDRAWLAFALALGPGDDDEGGDLQVKARVELAACELGIRRFPRSAALLLRAGQLLGALDRQGDLAPLAVARLEDALALDRQSRVAATILAELYRRRLGDLARAERIDAASAQLARLEVFHADAARRWPKEPLAITLADAYLTMGIGLYSVGEIAAAVKMYEKARAQGPSAEALEQLATVEMKRGQFAAAARDFEAAAQVPRERPIDAKLDEVRLHRLQGEALEALGARDQARSLWQGALDDSDLLWSAGLTTAGKAMVLVERARLFALLGEAAKAREAFARAIDAESQSVYTDAIAFFLTRGQLEPALDAYHSALGRESVDEYFKTYTSLWVVDFARLRGRDPDPLAVEYLAGRTGHKWYHELARYTLGRMTFAELLARADTRGKRAEAYFYEAMARYAARDDAGAAAHLRQVIATDMLGFYEFDMAVYFLKHGPPR